MDEVIFTDRETRLVRYVVKQAEANFSNSASIIVVPIVVATPFLLLGVEASKAFECPRRFTSRLFNIFNTFNVEVMIDVGSVATSR